VLIIFSTGYRIASLVAMFYSNLSVDISKANILVRYVFLRLIIYNYI